MGFLWFSHGFPMVSHDTTSHGVFKVNSPATVEPINSLHGVQDGFYALERSAALALRRVEDEETPRGIPLKMDGL